MISVQITERGFGQIKRGSLWIFANEFVTKMRDLVPGTWAEFYCKSEFVGSGYVNPHSLISGRICSREKILNRKKYFVSALSLALERKASYQKHGSYRLLFSESDNTPGLILDIYQHMSENISDNISENNLEKSPADSDVTVVAQSTTAGMDAAIDDWQAAVEQVLNPSRFYIRGDSSVRHLEGVKPMSRLVRGDLTDLTNSALREDDVKFAADFVKGQKTGFFLDQRENRGHLKSVARDKTVLDLCCYSGGWGLSALKGGAKHVTFVDQSEDALALVSKGLSLNGFEQSQATLCKKDIFEYFLEEPQKFDVIVCDPPAFVKSKKNLPQAIKAYSKLNGLAIRRLKMGGLLYTCSCSYHLSEEEFLKILAECFQKEKLCGTVVYRGSQAGDHPWILNRPESKYLKCLGIRVSPLF